MVMKSFNTVIVLVNVVVVVALFITWWPPSSSSLSQPLHHGLVKNKNGKEKKKKSLQTECVYLVCFQWFSSSSSILVHGITVRVHVIMVLFLSRHEGSPSPCVNIVLVGCTVNAS